MPKFLILLLALGLHVQAQDTTQTLSSFTTDVHTSSADSQLASPTELSDVQPLLPHTMLITQRAFWGPKGLLRLLTIAPLTAEGREKELKVRRFMLVAHQATGYVTLAGFVMQGILTAKLNNATGSDYDRLYTMQQTTATITNIAYGTTALLSLTAPPKLATDGKRTSGVKLHKYLSIIHLTGFIATNILARQVTQHSDLRPYHQAATLTTLAAFAPALIALKF